MLRIFWFSTLSILFLCNLIFSDTVSDSDSLSTSWEEIDGIIYGAIPDSLGQIGGGSNFSNIIKSGTFNVENIDQLISALNVSKEGDTVFIKGEAIIDLTSMLLIEKYALTIPSGVVLAGNRGDEGSKGAIIISNVLDTPFMVKTLGSNVKISGLRIRGPNDKQYIEHHKKSFGDNGKGREYYYKFPLSIGIYSEYSELEVSNCEISAFSHSGIYLKHGENNIIHHNYIHHCQFQGLGYGICQDVSSSIIEYNLFNWNRHSIAGTGKTGCSYIARNNVELGNSLSHVFDMHGGVDRKDKTNIAGSNIEIYNNTFYSKKVLINIRGNPEKDLSIYQNWFKNHSKSGKAIKSTKKIDIKKNKYGFFY